MGVPKINVHYRSLSETASPAKITGSASAASPAMTQNAAPPSLPNSTPDTADSATLASPILAAP